MGAPFNFHTHHLLPSDPTAVNSNLSLARRASAWMSCTRERMNARAALYATLIVGSLWFGLQNTQLALSSMLLSLRREASSPPSHAYRLPQPAYTRGNNLRPGMGRSASGGR